MWRDGRQRRGAQEAGAGCSMERRSQLSQGEEQPLALGQEETLARIGQQVEHCSRSARGFYSQRSETHPSVVGKGAGTRADLIERMLRCGEWILMC